MNENYRKGFGDGYRTAYAEYAMGRAASWMAEDYPSSSRDIENLLEEVKPRYQPRKSKRKVRQTPKQKLLTQMTKKKWDTYKKGKGRKTYVQIRAEVSRSQAFKKKAKRL